MGLESKAGKLILVVEDDPMIRLTLRQALEYEGYAVVSDPREPRLWNCCPISVAQPPYCSISICPS